MSGPTASTSTGPGSPPMAGPAPPRNTLKKPNPHAPPSPALIPVSPQTRALSHQGSFDLASPSSARTSSANLARSPAASHPAYSSSPPLNRPLDSSWESAGRASPALSTRSSGRTPRLGSQQGSSSNIGKSLESYSAKHVVAALDSGEGPAGGVQGLDDVWSAVCVRVLPLFNGEGLRAPVEDLNELVHTHVERTLARVRSQVAPTISSRHRSAQQAALISTDAASLLTALLAENLTDLINIGCITLSVKLWPPPPTPPLSDAALLARLGEVWHFFLTQVLPGLESVFWSLRSDQRLQAAVRGAGGSRTGRPPVQGEDEGRIDVRSLALIGFRDQLILPHLTRLGPLFGELAEERGRGASPAGRGRDNLDVETPERSGSHQRGNTSINSIATLVPSANGTPGASGTTTPAPQPAPALPPSSQAGSARRRQLVATLASVLTGDERQFLIEDLLRTMRTGNPGGIGPRPSGGQGFSTEGAPTGTRRESLFASPLLDEPSSPEPGRAIPNAVPTDRMGRARAGTMDSLDEEVLPLPESLRRTGTVNSTQESVPPPLPTFMSGPLTSSEVLMAIPHSSSMSLLNLSNPSSNASAEQTAVGAGAGVGQAEERKKKHHFLGRMMRTHSSGVEGKKEKDK